MRILIAGCGYVGVRLAECLHRDGHTVFGLRRSPPDHAGPFSWIRGDLTRPDSFSLPEVDALVLAAGLRRDTEEQYQRLFAEGYRTLLEKALASHQSLHRVVMVSTTGVFAEQDGGWVDETSDVDDSRIPGRYFLDAEKTVQQAPCTSVVVRLSGIYGPERIRLIREVREGHARRYPAPPHYLNHLHADDAAGSIRHVLILKNPAPLYIASDTEPADRNEVLQWISDQLDMDPLPEAAHSDERPSRRSGNKRCRSNLLTDSGYRFSYPTFREGYASLIRMPSA